MGRIPVYKDKKIKVTPPLKDGQSQRTVAKKVAVSRCCVGNVSKKLKVDALLTNECYPGKVENDFQLTVKIGTYYKFAKQIEPKIAVSYHRTLHFQIDTQLSVRTIRRRFLDAGYRRYIDKRKSIRNALQRKL